MEVGVVLRAEIGFRHIHVPAELAAAHGAAAQAGGDIVRRAHEAHHRERPAREGVADLAVHLLHRHGVADLHAALAAQRRVAEHAFAVVFRHAALQHDGAVQVIPVCVGGVGRQAVDARGHVLAVHAHERVGAVAGHDVRHALSGANGFHVLLREAEGAHEAGVHEAVLVIIAVHRGAHVRRGGAQAAVKAGSECDDHEQSHEAAPRVRDGAQRILPKSSSVHSNPPSARAVCHHSIVSAETGEGFVSMAVTFPFRMWITRSAMAVNAWLCVMTTTVRPVWRQVSCSRHRMALPVL